MKTGLWRAASALAIGTALAAGIGAQDFDARSTVFERGTAGYDEVRIPALVTAQDGTLLAFGEGRRRDPLSTHSDHGRNDILLRRSADGGATWGEVIPVQADRDIIYINPCAVTLPSGRVLLMYQTFPFGYHARPIGEHIKVLEPGVTGERISRTFLQWSDDHGATWSAPKDVTAQTKRPAPIVSTATGPGVGIVLERGPHKGRVIFPTNEGWWEGDTRYFNVYACYSDDNGETWAYGDVAPMIKGEIVGDEVQMAELPDGRLILNSRGLFGVRRLVAHSEDGGETWSALKADDELPEPRCMASLIRYSWPEEGKSRLLFSNPATNVHDDRTHGTVRVSYDEGETWSVAKAIVPGEFAYSCLTRLKDGSIGILCETEHYGKIEFIRFTLDWLESE